MYDSEHKCIYDSADGNTNAKITLNYSESSKISLTVKNAGNYRFAQSYHPSKGIKSMAVHIPLKSLPQSLNTNNKHAYTLRIGATYL
jgi:hypothetical protein